MTMYRIVHLHLKERTKDSWDYTNLLDALTVAKSVINATSEEFDPEVWKLMTSGFIETKGMMVFLWKIGDDGYEHPVVSPSEFAAGLITLPDHKITKIGHTNG